jgi:hypothetical protein
MLLCRISVIYKKVRKNLLSLLVVRVRRTSGKTHPPTPQMRRKPSCSDWKPLLKKEHV